MVRTVLQGRARVFGAETEKETSRRLGRRLRIGIRGAKERAEKEEVPPRAQRVSGNKETECYLTVFGTRFRLFR